MKEGRSAVSRAPYSSQMPCAGRRLWFGWGLIAKAQFPSERRLGFDHWALWRGVWSSNWGAHEALRIHHAHWRRDGVAALRPSRHVGRGRLPAIGREKLQQDRGEAPRRMAL